MELELLQIGRAAKEVGMSIARLRFWARNGLVPCTTTMGGRYRFTRHQINEIKQAMGIENDETATASRATIRDRVARSAGR